jgi:6-phosphofructokinase 2
VTVLALTLNPTVDVTWEVDHLRSSGKNRARVRNVVAGGGGINVVRGVRRLGGDATALHTVGPDLGRRLTRLLDDEGLDHAAIEVEGDTREAFILYEAEPARTYHVVPPGPRLTDEEARRCLEVLAESAARHPYVVLSGSLPDGVDDDFYARAARQVEEAGARVVLDTSGPALAPAAKQGVFLLKSNKREARTLVGQNIDSFDDAREASAALLADGAAEIVVMTLGEYGALCATAEAHHEVRTPPLPGEAVSDAGAGDSLVAAMTLRLAEGHDPVDACAWGIAAASASVLTPGTELFRRSDAASLRPQVEIR